MTTTTTPKRLTYLVHGKSGAHPPWIVAAYTTFNEALKHLKALREWRDAMANVDTTAEPPINRFDRQMIWPPSYWIDEARLKTRFRARTFPYCRAAVKSEQKETTAPRKCSCHLEQGDSPCEVHHSHDCPDPIGCPACLRDESEKKEQK